MKSTKGAIVGYKPEPVPSDLPQSAQRYLDTELNRIAGIFQALMTVVRSSKSLALDPSFAEPATPVMYEIVYAAGAPYWDPGSGQGYYYWNGSVWTPLG